MKLLLTLFFLISSCVTTPKQQTYKFTQEDILAAQKINEILPFELQVGVFLVKVELLESGTLKSTVQIKDARLIKYFRKFGVKNIVSKKFVCADPDTRDFLLKEGILTYEVISSKESFGSVSVTKKDCPNLRIQK